MGETSAALAHGPTSMAWNPAGLARGRGFNASLGYAALPEGLSLIDWSFSFRIVRPVIGFSVLAAKYEGADDMRAPGGTIGIADGADIDLSVATGIGFANPRFLGGRGWTGLSIAFVAQATGASVPAGSIGAIVPLTDATTVAVSLQHLAGKADGYSMPTSAKVGATQRLRRDLLSALDVGYGIGDGIISVRTGAEYGALGPVVLRAGYRWDSSDGYDAVSGVTGGFSFWIARRLGLDYACQPFGEYGMWHRASLEWGMAPPVRVSEE